MLMPSMFHRFDFASSSGLHPKAHHVRGAQSRHRKRERPEGGGGGGGLGAVERGEGRGRRRLLARNGKREQS